MTDKDTYSGKVCWFNAKQGFGFIEWNKNNVKQKDMFVHFSDVNMDGFRVLKAEQIVTFSIGKNNKGDPKAVDVYVVR